MKINNSHKGLCKPWMKAMALIAVFFIALCPPVFASSGGGEGHETGSAGHESTAPESTGHENTGHESGGHESGTHEGGWAATDWYRVMNFGILAVALFMIAKKPVNQLLSARIAGIKEQLGELEEKKAAAEKELAQYNEKLTQLSKEAEKIVDEYIRQGNDAKDRILKEAEDSAAKLEEKAKKSIEHEFTQARVQLQAEIIEKALAKAEADIISKISSEDQDRLVDEYLEKVVA